MVTLGAEHGVRTTALLTRMDTPLGRAVGNAVEVEEAVATLAGGGPPDLAEVTLALAAEMLALAGLAPVSAAPAAALADGRALDRYRAMIRAQGGDPDAPLPRAAHAELVTAAESGWLRRLDARARRGGRLAARGRPGQEGGSGERGRRGHLPGQAGDRVERGQPLLELRGDTEIPVRQRQGRAGRRDRDRSRPPDARSSWSGSETLAPPEPDNS